MKVNNNLNYKYLLNNFSVVNRYLKKGKQKDNGVIEAIISFCIVTEKILKVHLYKKNSILIYPENLFRGGKEDLICLISSRKEGEHLETVGISRLLDRYKLIFKNRIKDDHLIFIKKIFSLRNKIIHSPASDDEILQQAENIYQDISIAWEVVAQEVKRFFKGKVKIEEPEVKYSENEINEIIRKELYSKIYSNYLTQPISLYNEGFLGNVSYGNTLKPLQFINDKNLMDNSILNNTGFNIAEFGSVFEGEFISGKNECPRCKQNTLQKNILGLYICTSCNLELTRKEYEILKEDNLLS